jgi:hypothetical protein
MLSDRPTNVMRWNSGIEPYMLALLGELAVASAHMEELLHQLYWKHAGLDEKSGPIVTDNLSPKRLSEDIKKLAALDPTKAPILEDLKILFKEFEDINTKRNHCLHWIWSVIETETKNGDMTEIGDINFGPYKVSRPAYRQSGIESQEFDVKGVEEICKNCNWLNRRLYSHTLSENVLRNLRGSMKPLDPLVDLFWPRSMAR